MSSDAALYEVSVLWQIRFVQMVELWAQQSNLEMPASDLSALRRRGRDGMKSTAALKLGMKIKWGGGVKWAKDGTGRNRLSLNGQAQ